jgi:hypothetical protein
LRGLFRQAPWRDHLPLGEKRMADWLHLLGCEVKGVQRFYSVPPLGGGRLRRSMVQVDQWGSRFNSPLGGIYLLHATKQVLGLPRPKQVQRSKPGRMIGLVPKPTPSPTPTAGAPQCSNHSKEGRINN